VLRVTEVDRERLTTVVLRASTRFTPEPAGCGPTDDTPVIRLLAEPGLLVETIHLDHKIPCLAFAASEPTHLNIDTDALRRFELAPGAWLNRLKDAVRAGEPEDTPIGIAPGRTMPLGALRADLVNETPGQRIVYVTDTGFSPDNVARILRLSRGADLLVCEAPFLDAEREHAASRAHLTARQAGALARWAGVRHLKLFHFSPRHDGQEEELRREAFDEFTGREIRYGGSPDGRSAPVP